MTQSNESNDRQSLLRWSLRGNAVFSALSGALFSVGAAAVASAIGLADPAELLVVGLNLLGFAGLLAYLSSRAVIPLKLAMLVVWLDLAWVVATVPVVAADVLDPRGAVAAVAVAGVVSLFALAQYLGIRRVRQSGFAGAGSA